MKRCFRRVVVGVLALSGLGATAGAGELRGRFLFGDKPAQGVTVSAVPYEAPLDLARREARRLPAPPPIASVKTGADGSFVLAVPAPPQGERLFTVRAEGGGSAGVAFAGYWSAAESDDLGDHVLLRGARLGGRVTDGKGEPVAGAEVTLEPQLGRMWDPDLEAAPRFATTAADGTFQFDDADPGANVVTADKPGFLPARKVGVRPGTATAKLVLGAGVPVAGSVLKPDAASPAAGALVRLEGRVTTRWVETAADGSFKVPNAPPGAVTAVADAGDTGYLEQRGLALPLAEGKSLVLVLRPPSALAGRTVDAKTTRPVPRVRVEVSAGGTTRSTRSGADGTYALRALPPRSWDVRADEPRYVAWTHAPVQVWPGETAKLDVPLVLGASISGRVTDESAKPVTDATGTLGQLGPVSLARSIRRMRGDMRPIFRTAADGTFKAARLAPGENQLLTVRHAEFEQATLGGLVLAPGATKAGISIVLKRGATLTGTVKDANGQPIAGAQANLSQRPPLGGGRGRMILTMASTLGADAKSATTGTDGKFAIAGLTPGEYSLAVTLTGYATERIDPVKVPEEGSPAPVEVTLAPGAAISGRVVRRSGVGAEGLMVSANPPGQPFRGGGVMSRPTDSDGSFVLDGLKLGASYDLQLFGPSGPAEGKRGVVAPATGVEITVPGLGRITGTALDAKDGHPLTDFQVSCREDRGGPFVAVFRTAGGGGPGQPVDVHSADGSFAIEDVPPGTWSVNVTAKGYQPARTGGVQVEEGATREGVEVRVAKGAVLNGRVVDASTGGAITNASVTLVQPSARPGLALLLPGDDSGVTTDADGKFEIDGAATGKQSLRVTHPDYTDATQSVDVAEDGASVEVRMTQGGVITGLVASDTGQPVPGATVDLSQAGTGGFGLAGVAGAQTAMADTAGGFRFDHLAAGRYTVTASLGSRTSLPVSVVLLAGTPPQPVTLQLQTGVTIEGTVTGLPAEMLGGMTVTANGADNYFQSTRVGADGRFEFANVPVGVVTLRGMATDAGGSTRGATKQVTASADQPVLTVQLVFDQGFSLSGRVTQGGQPISGANVVAVLQGGGGRQASALTDSGGSYQLNGLQEGTYSVMAMVMFSGTPATKRVTATIDSDQTVDIALPNSKITGQVVDADGNAPLANATVAITARDPAVVVGFGQRQVITDSNGQFSFTGLEDGSYSLTTSRTDYQLDTRDASASEDGGSTVVVTLKRGSGIGIKVLDGLTGVPLPGVMVRVLSGAGAVFGPAPVTLDGNGQGEIPSLPPATYTVIAEASGYAPVRLDNVTVPSAVVTLVLTPGGTILVQAGPKTLATGTASGTVVTATGQPALLSLFNTQGRILISEPNLQLRNVPPGSYVLSIPAASISQTFTVGEGAQTVVNLP